MTLYNENQKVNELRKETQNHSLPGFAWPGGYPIFYINSDMNVLCPECANQNDEYNSTLVDVEINWEDDLLFCNNCSLKIESSYG